MPVHPRPPAPPAMQPGPPAVAPPNRLLALMVVNRFEARSDWPCANLTCRAPGRLVTDGHAAAVGLDDQIAHAQCVAATLNPAADGQLLSLAETLTYRERERAARAQLTAPATQA